MKNKQKAKFSFGAYLSFFTRFPIPWWLFLLSLLLGLANTEVVLAVSNYLIRINKGELYNGVIIGYALMNVFNALLSMLINLTGGYGSALVTLRARKLLWRKILHLPEMKVSCTCARVPVIRSHSVSVVLRTKEKISVKRAKELIANAPGCKLVDDLKNKVYPMPLDTSDQDIVYVGRIREDLTDERGLNLWCCGDQVRKGAATNTIQIAELLLK